MAPLIRSRTFYRVILALPVAMLTFLAASGRLAVFWGLVVRQAPTPEQADGAFITSLLWLVSIAPLLVTAWVLGRDHTAARRLGYDGLLGIREVVLSAIGRERSAAEAAQFAAEAALPVRDNPRAALGTGIAVALLVPAFFASFAPPLRTPAGLLWLGVAGVLMGSGAYARRRAMAYLRDEPERFDPFREWRLLRLSRYDERGRAFVRWESAVMILLPLWWLGAGYFLVLRS